MFLSAGSFRVSDNFYVIKLLCYYSAINKFQMSVEMCLKQEMDRVTSRKREHASNVYALLLPMINILKGSTTITT